MFKTIVDELIAIKKRTPRYKIDLEVPLFIKLQN